MDLKMFQDHPVFGFVDWVLRGIGQVVFQNNPVGGQKHVRHSNEKIALRHRKNVGGFASNDLAIDANFVILRVDFDLGRQIVVDHVLLANRSGVIYCNQ